MGWGWSTEEKLTQTCTLPHGKIQTQVLFSCAATTPPYCPVHASSWIILNTQRAKCPSLHRVTRFTLLHSCSHSSPFLFLFSVCFFALLFLFSPSFSLSFSPFLSSSDYLIDSDWSSFPHQSTAERDRARQLQQSMFIQLIIHTFPSNIVTLQLRQQNSELTNKGKVIWFV